MDRHLCYKALSLRMGKKTITIDEMLKAPQDFDLSTKDTEFLRRVKRGTVKIADEKDGIEIVSCSIEDFFLHGGMLFEKDADTDNRFLYKDTDGVVLYEIKLKTLMGYYRGFSLDVYKDEAFWPWKKEMKKQVSFVFERK